MTFLQPWILWGLPLVLVPVLIHLINRMRYRSQPWAAMQFLLSATRDSLSQAKVRQFLILLFRVLAVLALILFLGRPIAGGWMGWALSPAPEAILVLLDRSASMETEVAGAGQTRREVALEMLAGAARSFEGASRLILLDSATRVPHELASAGLLRQPALTGPTDTAADYPALLQVALSWILENRAGLVEIWMASDLQRANWQPDDPRLKTVLAQFDALPQKVSFRLLAVGQPPERNAAVAVADLVRRVQAERNELLVTLDFMRSRTAAEAVPLTAQLDGAPSQLEVPLEGGAFRWRQKLDLGAKQGEGWVCFRLPADANPRDNTAYGVYGAVTEPQAMVAGTDLEARRRLRLAAAVCGKPGAERGPVELIPADVASADWSGQALLFWQGPLPTGALEDKLRGFVEQGGCVLFLPPGMADPGRFSGVGWGEAQDAEADKPFRVLRWDEEQGPLARTDEGLSLPLPAVEFVRRQGLVGAQNVLAAFDDGAPFLARLKLGRGEVYFCASLPQAGWSGLGDGPVLVPMTRRLLESGSRRLQRSEMVYCGEMSAGDKAATWACVDAPGAKDIRLHAGVYRAGERWVAANRPPAEDEPEVMEAAEARQLFGNLPLQLFEEKRRQAGNLQGEIWRLLLFGMLVFLVVEGWLVLPPRTAPAQAPGPGRGPKEVGA